MHLLNIIIKTLEINDKSFIHPLVAICLNKILTLFKKLEISLQ